MALKLNGSNFSTEKLKRKQNKWETYKDNPREKEEHECDHHLHDCNLL